MRLQSAKLAKGDNFNLFGCQRETTETQSPAVRTETSYLDQEAVAQVGLDVIRRDMIAAIGNSTAS